MVFMKQIAICSLLLFQLFSFFLSTPVYAKSLVKGVVSFTGEPSLLVQNKSEFPKDQCGELSEEEKKQLAEVQQDPKKAELAGVLVFVSSAILPNSPHQRSKEIKKVSLVGCKFTPSLIVLDVKQPLRFVHSGKTIHSIHGRPLLNPVFNLGILPDKPYVDTSFEIEEPKPFVIACDVHNRVQGAVMVLDHPFYAITDENGVFRIENIPEGQHELTFWHSKLGLKVISIDVKEGGLVDLKVSLSSPGSS